jgi:hypothetical protein
MKTPDWNFWQHMPDAELWQAVLLSLNIDPDQFDSEYGNYHDYLREDKEASKRLRLLDANRYVIYPLGVDRLIPLPQFAKWAVSVMQWPGLPSELVVLARGADDAPAPQSDADVSTGEFDTADGTTIGNEESEDDTDEPPYLTTSDLVGCFCGYMGVNNPAKVLSEYPKWATRNGALVSRGKRGKPTNANPDSSAWNPVQFALNLLNKKPLPQLDEIGDLKQQHLDTVFSMKSLAKWKPIWTKSKPF